MKNRVKEAILQIKRELSNAQYFVERIETKQADSKNVRLRQEAQRAAKLKNDALLTIKKIHEIVSTELKDLEKEIEVKEIDARAELFRRSLGTINAPTAAMKKTAESFIEVSKKPHDLIKRAVQEQLRRESSLNVKKTVAADQSAAGH